MWIVIRYELKMQLRKIGYWAAFLLIILACIYSIPTRGSGYAVVAVGLKGAVYDSRFVGAVVAVVSAFLLGLVGFYLVGDMLRKDERWRVAPVLMSTPINNTQYILGKYFGNLLSLMLIIIAAIVTAIIMQVVRDEAPFQAISLLMPFLIFTTIAIIFVSSLALILGALGWTGVGTNILYGLYWFFMGNMIPGGSVGRIWGKTPTDWLDYIGGSLIHNISLAITKGYGYAFIYIRPELREQTKAELYHWPGIQLTGLITYQRLMYVVLALVLIFFSIKIFKRFDPAPEKRIHNKARL